MDEGKKAWDADSVSQYDGPDPDEKKKKGKMGQKRWVRILLVNVILCILVIIYCVGGSYLFGYIENGAANAEKEARRNASFLANAERLKIAAEIAAMGNATDATYLQGRIDAFHNVITQGIVGAGWNAKPFNDSTYQKKWAFESSLLFCVTIVTTIGYGHISPVTVTGQMVVIIYALIGVPLMLMFLANVGEVMANIFRIVYGRGCCYFCWKRRQRNYEYNREMVRKARAGRGRSAWFDKDGTRKRTRNGTSRSPSPVKKGKEKKLTKEQEEIDWEYLRTIDPDSIQSPDDEVINVPITLTLVVIAVYIFLGAVLFAQLENWSWIKGAYFSFVTLSTIGFGDLVPGWNELGSTHGFFKLMASVAYIIFGLAVLSMSFNLMMEEMLSKFRWLGRKLGILNDNGEDDGEWSEDEDDSRANSPSRKLRSRSGSRDGSRSGSRSRSPKKGANRPTTAESAMSDDDGEMDKYRRKYL